MIRWAVAVAEEGTRTEMMISADERMLESEPTSSIPFDFASSRLREERPSRFVMTRTEFARRSRPKPLPMSPGERIATVLAAMVSTDCYERIVKAEEAEREGEDFLGVEWWGNLLASISDTNDTTNCRSSAKNVTIKALNCDSLNTRTDSL